MIRKLLLSFVGFSNTAEILKLLIVFLPNFIVLISWGVLMLVIASQVVGVKQIYNLKVHIYCRRGSNNFLCCPVFFNWNNSIYFN